MRSRNIFFFGATLSVFLMSCSQTIPFTGKVQQQYKLSENDLKHLQFYTSSQIVLYKADQNGEASPADGVLVVEKDRQLDRIVIPRGTAGQVVQVYPDRLAVSFEVETGKFLVFGSKYIDGVYRLQAKTWTKRHGELQYGGETWLASPGSGEAYLLIKVRKLEDQRVETKVVSGRKVDLP